MSSRVRRCELVTPATSESALAKSATLPADVVIVDLEDSVGAGRKAEARLAAAAAIASEAWTAPSRAVRINAPGSGLALADLSEVIARTGSRLDVVVVPKVRSARDVWWVDTTLTELEAQHRVERRIGIEVLIEDTAAMAELRDIAGSSRRIEALAFGPGDFSASQGVDLRAAGNDRPDLYPGDIWHSVRSAIAIAASAAGIVAIDGAYGAIDDLAGFERECVRARTLGFVGKWAIHPGQVEVATSAFTPDAAQVAAAKRVVNAYENALDDGNGALAHAGELVDAATLRTARRLIASEELS